MVATLRASRRQILPAVREGGFGTRLPLRYFTTQLRGVHVIDTVSRQTVSFIDFQEHITEVFDVSLMPGKRFPAVIGFQRNMIQRACTIGQEREIGHASNHA